MSYPHPVGSVRVRLFVLCVAVAAVTASCGGVAETGDTALVLGISSSSITLENRTGTSLTKGQIAVVPEGIPRPYVVLLPYISSGEKRTFPLNTFRAQDGTPFRTDIAKGRSVKVTVTDASGQIREHEVPFK
jgi:hypothetical protein